VSERLGQTVVQFPGETLSFQPDDVRQGVPHIQQEGALRGNDAQQADIALGERPRRRKT
jgi:hypothetical protein